MFATRAWRARTFASFERPAFRRYYAGLLCNMAGFWLRIAATGWYAYELTGSKAALGTITVAALLPWAPIAPLAGVLAERVDQRRYLIAVYVALGVVNGALALGIVYGRVGWTELLVATVLVACLRGMELPARHAIVRRTVDRDLLPNAIGLNAAGFHLMGGVGFALAGQVYAIGGPAACYAGVALAAVAMAAILGTLKLGAQAKPLERKHPLRELGDGFRYVWAHGLTRTLIFGAMAVVGLLLSFRVLMPSIAKDILGLGDRGYGWLMSAGGAGSFLAAVWVASGSGGRGRRIRNLFATVWVGSVAVVAIGWTSNVLLAAPAMLAAGFCQVGFMASANTTVQESVPDHLRARVMGIWALIFGAAYPVGGLLQGLVAEAAGERWALSGGAALALGLSLLLFATRAKQLKQAVHCEDVAVRQSQGPGDPIQGM